VLAPTLRDTARLGFLSTLGSPWVLVSLATLALLALFASELLQDPGKSGLLEVAEEMSYPLIGIILWAGFWGLLNRLLAHRSNFGVHLAIAFAGVASLFVVSQLVSFVGFALDWGKAVWWLRWVSRIILLAGVVFAHLRYFSQARIRRQALLAGFAAVLLFGTPAVGSLIEKTRFSSLPWLDPLLRPPAYQWRKGVPVKSFMQRAQSLRERADEEAKD
jgi:hypothetical protein